MNALYQLAKFLHICGFITAVGVSLSSLVVYNQFWKLYNRDHKQGIAAFRAFNKLQITGMIGLTVIIAAGITMLAIAHWSYIFMLWMHIKLTLVALIIIFGFVMARSSTSKLRKLIDPNYQIDGSKVDTVLLRRHLNIFFIVQLAGYTSIIFLSVFRFN